MSTAFNQTARDYERDADETRHRLSSSLDELANSLTPGRMLDEVMHYARSGGADFLRGLGNAASANPIPTLLIGVGAAMFLSGKGRIGMNGGKMYRAAADERDTRGESVLRHAAERMPERRRGRSGGGLGQAARSAGSALRHGAVSVETAAEGAARSVGSAVSDAAGAVGSAVTGAAGAVGSAATTAAKEVRSGAAAAGSLVSEAAEQAAQGAAGVGYVAAGIGQIAADAVSQGAHSVSETVGEFAGSARDTVVHTSEQLRDQTARLAREVGDRANTLIQEQPLIVAAAGLALGAAIAALLPRTRVEDSFMGETSDALKETVTEVASQQYEQAKSTANRVVEDVKTAAMQEGLSATAAVGAVRDLGEKLKHVVTAGGEAVAETAEKRKVPEY